MVEKLGNLPYSYQEDIKKATQILKENGAKKVFIFISFNIITSIIIRCFYSEKVKFF